MGSMIVGVVVFGLMVLAVFHIYKDYTKGGCGGGCGGCPRAKDCHKELNDNK